MALRPALPHLSELLNERPDTKMGQVTAAWPHIREALQAGHTLKAVWERLRADGVDIRYNRLSEYIGRIQRRGADQTTASAPAPPQAGKRERVSPPFAASRAKDDPTANLRERLDRSTGFAYRGTGKKEDLV
jgi:hypothetical protein